MITGAQAIVDCLRRERIDHVFGIPGTMNLPILDVLRATPEIRSAILAADLDRCGRELWALVARGMRTDEALH